MKPGMQTIYRTEAVRQYANRRYEQVQLRLPPPRHTRFLWICVIVSLFGLVIVVSCPLTLRETGLSIPDLNRKQDIFLLLPSNSMLLRPGKSVRLTDETSAVEIVGHVIDIPSQSRWPRSLQTECSLSTSSIHGARTPALAVVVQVDSQMPASMEGSQAHALTLRRSVSVMSALADSWSHRGLRP
jgi:hypothetical protein